tara:strand:+ start:17373 stop:17618 length:246 start_codon:yes stop_codon:yes gene_type:complete
MNNKENCPHCGNNLQGAEIKQEDRHLFGGVTHFGRKIGWQDPDIYDGVLFWKCPDCGEKWHRWPEGDWRREAATRRYGVTK